MSLTLLIQWMKNLYLQPSKQLKMTLPPQCCQHKRIHFHIWYKDWRFHFLANPLTRVDVIVWASIGPSLRQGQFELIDLPFIYCWGYYEHGSSDDNLGFGEPIHMKDWIWVHVAEQKTKKKEKKKDHGWRKWGKIWRKENGFVDIITQSWITALRFSKVLEFGENNHHHLKKSLSSLDHWQAKTRGEKISSVPSQNHN